MARGVFKCTLTSRGWDISSEGSRSINRVVVQRLLWPINAAKRNCLESEQLQKTRTEEKKKCHKEMSYSKMQYGILHNSTDGSDWAEECVLWSHDQITSELYLLPEGRLERLEVMKEEIIRQTEEEQSGWDGGQIMTLRWTNWYASHLNGIHKRACIRVMYCMQIGDRHIFSVSLSFTQSFSLCLSPTVCWL